MTLRCVYKLYGSKFKVQTVHCTSNRKLYCNLNLKKHLILILHIENNNNNNKFCTIHFAEFINIYIFFKNKLSFLKKKKKSK